MLLEASTAKLGQTFMNFSFKLLFTGYTVKSKRRAVIRHARQNKTATATAAMVAREKSENHRKVRIRT